MNVFNIGVLSNIEKIDENYNSSVEGSDGESSTSHNGLKRDQNDIPVRAYQQMENIFTETSGKNTIECYQTEARKTSPSNEDEKEDNALRRLGYNNLGHYQESITYYKQAFELVSQFRDTKEKFDACLRLGSAFGHIGEIKASRNYFSKALTVAEQINDKNLQKEVYTNLGFVYHKSGRLDDAVESYLKLQKALNDLGHRKEKADACVLVGDIFQEMEQYENAIKSYQSAINIGKELDDAEMQIVASQKLGRLYLTLGSVSSKGDDYDKATKCYQEALIISGTEPIDDQLREQALDGLGKAWLNLRSNEEVIHSIVEPKNAAKKEVDPGEYYLISIFVNMIINKYKFTKKEYMGQTVQQNHSSS